jgi:hypothetical protein
VPDSWFKLACAHLGLAADTVTLGQLADVQDDDLTAAFIHAQERLKAKSIRTDIGRMETFLAAERHPDMRTVRELVKKIRGTVKPSPAGDGGGTTRREAKKRKREAPEAEGDDEDDVSSRVAALERAYRNLGACVAALKNQAAAATREYDGIIAAETAAAAAAAAGGEEAEEAETEGEGEETEGEGEEAGGEGEEAGGDDED